MEVLWRAKTKMMDWRNAPAPLDFELEDIWYEDAEERFEDNDELVSVGDMIDEWKSLFEYYSKETQYKNKTYEQFREIMNKYWEGRCKDCGFKVKWL